MRMLEADIMEGQVVSFGSRHDPVNGATQVIAWKITLRGKSPWLLT